MHRRDFLSFISTLLLPLNLGTTWIHGVKGNPLTGLAQTLKAKQITTR